MHLKHIHKSVTSGVEPDSASAFLILLHGRGATAESILPLAGHFHLKNAHIIAPQATNNAWYPYGFMAPVQENQPWLDSALLLLDEIIAGVISAPGGERKLYICGFSQGACLALEYAARNARQYGGIIAFTGGLIGEQPDETKYKGDFMDCPVFIGNSDVDPHVPLERSEYSRTIMEQMGAKVTLKIYPGMAHTVHPDEIRWVNENMFS